MANLLNSILLSTGGYPQGTGYQEPLARAYQERSDSRSRVGARACTLTSYRHLLIPIDGSNGLQNRPDTRVISRAMAYMVHAPHVRGCAGHPINQVPYSRILDVDSGMPYLCIYLIAGNWNDFRE